MKINKIILGLSILFSLTACQMSEGAKQSKQDERAELAKVEKDKNYICRTVKKTGSNMYTRRCITKEAHQREKESAHNAMSELNRSWNKNGG
ncbi:hypothetical protein [Pseudoalteromonas rubra]|uniref:Lipoprotein n=1 Tax=Pseudoalteromonas rubra TaxID=43658 RepID=A0A0F4QKE2_9GAMM|nr:hypothetical protein [Pseudoalteromonas rubra]KJZ07745.1 hypothetical protein TW77_14695 [Pseudoalteromonas rubra]